MKKIGKISKTYILKATSIIVYHIKEEKRKIELSKFHVASLEPTHLTDKCILCSFAKKARFQRPVTSLFDVVYQ